jgi:hypothetical protein
MKNPKTSIARRDGYIISQALAYASEMLNHFGHPHDEPSNRAVMDAMGVSFAEQYRAIAHAKLHRNHECYVVGGHNVPTQKYAVSTE